jgi:hypothetical protein
MNIFQFWWADYSISHIRIQTLLVLFLTILLGCDNKIFSEKPVRPVPLMPGEVLDKKSYFYKYWVGRNILVKLSDELILSMPPEHHRFWSYGGSSFLEPFPIANLPIARLAGFSFQYPSLKGYSQTNYEKVWIEEIVHVVSISIAPKIEFEPSQPGYWTPNVMHRWLGTNWIKDMQHEDLYGLNCYKKTEKHYEICWGQRQSNPDEYLIANSVSRLPLIHGENALFQTTYLSKRYGGVEITWRTSMSNAAYWRDIDEQVWKFIDLWNISPTKNGVKQ